MSEFELMFFCPGCHPGDVPDPLTEIIERCYHHPAQAILGEADAQAKLPTSLDPPGSESEISRTFCHLLHRPE